MFVDTNVLVYATQRRSPNRDAAGIALEGHAEVEARLCLSGQIVREIHGCRDAASAFCQTGSDARGSRGRVLCEGRCAAGQEMRQGWMARPVFTRGPMLCGSDPPLPLADFGWWRDEV
jgi:hypothetical protein